MTEHQVSVGDRFKIILKGKVLMEMSFTTLLLQHGIESQTINKDLECFLDTLSINEPDEDFIE